MQEGGECGDLIDKAYVYLTMTAKKKHSKYTAFAGSQKMEPWSSVTPVEIGFMTTVSASPSTSGRPTPDGAAVTVINYALHIYNSNRDI